MPSSEKDKAESDSGLGSSPSPTPSPNRIRPQKHHRIPHDLILDNASRLLGPPKTPSRSPNSPFASPYKICQSCPSPSATPADTDSDHTPANLSAGIPAHLAREHVYCTCYSPSSGEMVHCDNAECMTGWFHVKCLNNPEKGTLKRWGKFTCRSCRTVQELAKKEKEKPFPALAGIVLTKEVKKDIVDFFAIPGGAVPVGDPYGLASEPPVESGLAMAQEEYRKAKELGMEEEEGIDDEGGEEGFEYDENGDDHADVENHNRDGEDTNSNTASECEDEIPRSGESDDEDFGLDYRTGPRGFFEVFFGPDL